MKARDCTRHVVVFDCNVYLDVARMVGPDFSWPNFSTRVAQSQGDALPSPNPYVDSLWAVAVFMSGIFAGDEVLEVWSCTHIQDMVYNKAMESADPDPETGYHGLGWTDEQADHLVEELIEGILTRSNGDSLVSKYPEATPPLDHEDGLVMGACATLASEDPFCEVYCVTNDTGFLEAYKDGKLPSPTMVMSPARFVGLVRAARRALAIADIRA